MPDDDPWENIAPISDTETEGGIAIGRFRYLFDRLVYWRQRLGSAAGTAAWQQRLHQLVDEFLTAGNTQDELLQPLRNAIGDLGQTDSPELKPELIRHWMDSRLATSQQPGRLYSGGITFCGMQPMRNIPFAVICVLGMQDEAFPRRERPPEFDLMRDSWRAGDPHKGDEDRYLMLETLLCARRYLYFSYCARSLKDNSECQPSVLLRELLDYIDDCVLADDSSPASQLISCSHPMQPFSPKNFSAASAGYDRHWYNTACQLARSSASQETSRWHREALAPLQEFDPEIQLDSLLRFFEHPLRYFYNHRLQVRLPRLREVEDEELFSLEGLDSWVIARQLLRDFLAGKPIDRRLFSARGMLPHGRAAEVEWLELLNGYRDLHENLVPYSETTTETRTIDCRLDDGSRLTGEVSACYTGLGLMQFSASKRIKGGELISLWLNHLALCAAGQLEHPECSKLFAASTHGWQFRPIDSPMACRLLTGYLELYREGQGYPLPVFPDTSYALVEENDPDKGWRKAEVAWKGNDYRKIPGECSNDYVQLALYNNPPNPLADELFEKYSRMVFAPIIEQGGPVE